MGNARCFQSMIARFGAWEHIQCSEWKHDHPTRARRKLNRENSAQMLRSRQHRRFIGVAESEYQALTRLVR